MELVRQNVTPRAIMTQAAFENAIMVAAAIAGSTNCPIHVNAIARHCGVELTNGDWERVGARYLISPAVTWRAVIFDGHEDYLRRIDDPDLDIDENCILVVRYVGNIAYPGSAEVVNMQPPAALIMRGIEAIPTLGDGRQSGTADAPSILNVSPEAAVGGNLAILRTGDRITLDIPNHRLDVELSDEEIAARWRDHVPPTLIHQTPWQELYRAHTGQMDTGSCLDFAVAYQDIIATKGLPRDSH